MQFPYEHYKTLTEPIVVYYPTGEETLARWVERTIQQAGTLLTQLLGRPMPELEILVVHPADWETVPHSEMEELSTPHPFWTDVTSPPSIVVPTEIDPIFGEIVPEKFAFMLYHELSLAFLEDEPRPWPEESPLWADEWQFKFAALWLSQRLDGVQGVVNRDLHELYSDIFEPEPDGKTPITVRGFDWYEDTTAEDYLCYELLLEQFAADLLKQSHEQLLPRFLALYRAGHAVLLSDDVTAMLVEALGSEKEAWLEGLVYF
jgi:hypothetical protein